MHTTEGQRFRFFHDSDYSGDVTMVDKETGQEIEVPFDDLKRFVANWVMDRAISRLENAKDDDILLHNFR